MCRTKVGWGGFLSQTRCVERRWGSKWWREGGKAALPYILNPIMSFSLFFISYLYLFLCFRNLNLLISFLYIIRFCFTWKAIKETGRTTYDFFFWGGKKFDKKIISLAYCPALHYKFSICTEQLTLTLLIKDSASENLCKFDAFSGWANDSNKCRLL